MAIYGNSYWEIVAPAEITNLIDNPGVEFSACRLHGASGGVAASTSSSQSFGAFSLQISPSSASSSGGYHEGFSATSGTTYTFSCYFKGEAGIDYRLFFADTSGVKQGASTVFTATGDWERQELSVPASATATRRLYFTKDSGTDTDDFFVDALQVETGSPATTYCDGDQPGCEWDGLIHDSTSFRSTNARLGGSIINLNSDYDIIMQQQPGAGMPPLENIQTNLGFQDGGEYQRTKTQVRSFQLDGTVTGSDVTDFHFQRQRLIDLFKPDLTTPKQPFLLRYTGASGQTNQIRCHYDGGFELSAVNAEIEQFSLRMIAYDPYWESVGRNEAGVFTSTSLSGGELVRFRSRTGIWAAGSPGISSGSELSIPTGESLKLGPDKKAYFGSAAVSTPAPPTLMRWNFSTSALEEPVSSGNDRLVYPTGTACVLAIAFDSAQNLYAGGIFDASASNSVCNIGKLSGGLTGGDFSQVGDGFDTSGGDVVRDIIIDSQNNLYAGGVLTSSGSISGSTVFQFDGTEFQTFSEQLNQGRSGSDNIVRSMALNAAETLYVGGNFDSTSGSTAPSSVAYWSGTEWLNVGGAGSAGASINGTVRSILFDSKDILYIGGEFTGTFPDGSGSPSYLCSWDGTKFDDLGASLNGSIKQMTLNPESEDLHITGSFSSAGGLTACGHAIWDGQRWLQGDTSSSTLITDIIVLDDARIGAATEFNTAAFSIFSDSLTVTNNGTAAISPVFYVKLSSGTTAKKIMSIKNVTTSQSIYFDELSVQENEIITIDTRTGTIESTFNGDLINKVLPGSNFASFQLLPGINYLTAMGEGTLSITMFWTPRHWSLDGTL